MQKTAPNNPTPHHCELSSRHCQLSPCHCEHSEAIHSLIATLQSDYPEFTFRPGKRFTFKPPRTIIYETAPPQPFFALLTLHELAHALLEHKQYTTTISRLKHERDAWKRAKSLCSKYQVPYDEDFVQDQLDTYRDWLHQKSLCKTCATVRYESPSGTFHCPFCQADSTT